MAATGSGGDQWSETAMLVIDMQKDFVDPTMSKVALLSGEAILPAVTEAVVVARKRGIFIVWVVREHHHSGRDVELFRRHFYTDGKGLAVEGSEGAELADGLVIKESDYKLVKTRFSAFFATNLDSVLKTSGIKNLVIVDFRLLSPVSLLPRATRAANSLRRSHLHPPSTVATLFFASVAVGVVAAPVEVLGSAPDLASGCGGCSGR
uniref:Isochorismatase-like domain-containing protein n=1 Tax=Leersia perrieri TaxID=77586 RepID=A0A0D9VER8_9ORYZ